MHPCLCLLCLILIACCMPEIDGFISGKVVKLSGISSGGNVPGSLQPSTVLQTQLHHHRIHSSISMSNNVEDTTTITLQENASMWDKFQAAGKVLYKFSRPHTIKVSNFLPSFLSFFSPPLPCTH